MTDRKQYKPPYNHIIHLEQILGFAKKYGLTYIEDVAGKLVPVSELEKQVEILWGKLGKD